MARELVGPSGEHASISRRDQHCRLLLHLSWGNPRAALDPVGAAGRARLLGAGYLCRIGIYHRAFSAIVFRPLSWVDDESGRRAGLALPHALDATPTPAE